MVWTRKVQNGRGESGGHIFPNSVEAVRGTPTILFEYIAVGLPGVAYRMGFLNEIIGGGYGVLFDPNYPNTHAEGARNLLYHQEETGSI